MNGVNRLVATTLSGLRDLFADPLGLDWVWAVVVLGVGVGLLPAVGAVVVALIRKGIGSRYGGVESVVLVGIGLLSGGLLPLLVFASTGRIMARAASGSAVPGLSDSALAELTEPVEIIGSQAQLLGEGTVAAAFDPSADPTGGVRFGIALGLLAFAPLMTALFVMFQARLALRRGPAWPSKFFWLPTLVVAFLTAASPAGSSAALWLGASAGAFLGIIVVLLAGVPSRETVRRSLAPAPRSSRPARSRVPEPRHEPARIVSAQPGSRPAARDGRRPEPTRVDLSRAPAQQAVPDRLAERFASRRPEPPVIAPPVIAPPITAVPGAGAVVPPVPSPRPGTPPARVGPPPPTLVGPVPGLAGASPAGPRFTLLRRLGQGGFGRVWLAHDTRFGHTVAVKAAHAPDAETEQRIQREAHALRAVAHPHCVQILDMVHAASDPGLAELDGLVIVMEFVDGISLGELVRSRGLLDDVAAARVWASVAGALDAAHAQGVMHRDVKPGNVVVDKSGLAHLIDFGIARRTGDATMTMAGFVLGTPDFLAPEVAGGGKATPQSDSWQLAATVSYALTGQPPRGGHEDPVSGLRAAASGAPLKHLPPGSAHLALLKAALDTDPAQRPPLREARLALEDWLRRTGARPDGPVTEIFTRT